MRVLTSVVLTVEWLVLALAIPVAINVAAVPESRAWTVFAITSILIVAALALMKTPVGVWLGWTVQVIALLSSIIVPMLAILALIFAGLYFAAVRLGRRVDDIKAQRAAPKTVIRPPGKDPAEGTMAESDNTTAAIEEEKDQHE